MMPETLRFDEHRRVLELLDQRELPFRIRYVACSDAEEVARAIETMVVRGAPAIGLAAAFGLALEARKSGDLTVPRERLARSRPTAVNLFWALGRMRAVLAEGDRAGTLRARLVAEAQRIVAEDVAAFSGTREQSDDITLLALRFTPGRTDKT